MIARHLGDMTDTAEDLIERARVATRQAKDEGGKMEEWPEDLRVRQYPEETTS